MTEQTEDGWLSWSGGKCPVEPFVEVEVKVRDPGLELYARPAHLFAWWYSPPGDLDSATDIIAYRVVSEPAAPPKIDDPARERKVKFVGIMAVAVITRAMVEVHKLPSDVDTACGWDEGTTDQVLHALIHGAGGPMSGDLRTISDIAWALDCAIGMDLRVREHDDQPDPEN